MTYNGIDMKVNDIFTMVRHFEKICVSLKKNKLVYFYQEWEKD